MSNKIESGETRISSDPSNKDTRNRPSRQGGNLILSLLAGGGSLATVIGLDVNSQPASAAATEIPRGSGMLTYIRGAENDPKTSIEVGMMLYPGTPIDTAVKLAEGLDLVEPMPKYKDRIRISAAYLTQDPGCDLVNVLNGCNIEVIKKELAITKAAGVIWHVPVIVKAMEDRAAGSATLTSPFETPKIDNAYALDISPPIPRIIDKWAFVHEVIGHEFLKLADARLITGSKTNVGRGYYNCSRSPLETWGWVPTQWKGCESDPEAYIINPVDIMNRGSISNGKFAPEIWPYIDRVMSRLPQGWGEPYGIQIPNPPNVRRLQSTTNLQVYQSPGLEFTIAPQSPPNTTCIELKVMPAANKINGNPDGPGYHNILCGDGFKSINFTRPEMGKGGYFLLPGMSYNWEYRVSTSPTFLNGVDNPGWRWNEFTNPYTGESYIKPTDKGQLLVPARYSDKISLVSPRPGETVGPKSLIQWTNGDTDVFYYEVQASRDPKFETDPTKAIASVYWNLVHGGETKPNNSWQVPAGFELEEGVNWVRIRPRIQGDGTPVDWSQPQSFNVSKTASSKMITHSHPVYGWEPDADYGDGVIGPSKEDMKEWGKVIDYSDSLLAVVKQGSGGSWTIFNP